MTELEGRFQSAYIEPFTQGDTDTWMDVFADDVVALHDGLPPLEGKDAIRDFGNSVAANFVIARMDADVDEVRQNADWAWTRGRFVADFKARTDAAPPGVAGERHGKFLLLWERQDDGQWRGDSRYGQPHAAADSRAGGGQRRTIFRAGPVTATAARGARRSRAPAIAGMDSVYLARQMRQFRDGVRGASLEDLDGRQMSLIAALFDDDAAIDELAHYVAAMPRVTPRRTLSVPADGAAALYAPCAVCHGNDGERVTMPSVVPPLPGWTTGISRGSWWLFRDGLRGTVASERHGGQQMRAAASGLTDADIDKLAAVHCSLDWRN